MNMPVNLLFADEVLDQGIDPAGVNAAVGLLHRTAVERHKNVFLVSHRQDLRQTIDRVLLVTKENRFTTFAEA
jgi:ABC-type Mn2+/Zn2+ transport system ATPase subunit